MKIIKIALAVMVLVAIGIGIYFWTGEEVEVDEVKIPVNEDVIQIGQEIDSIVKINDIILCGKYYSTILYHIDEFYKQNRFSQNDYENTRIKNDFDKELYYAYVGTFIKLSYVVLGESTWNSEMLQFIDGETANLQKSEFLDLNSDANKDFKQFKKSINKYREIQRLIAECNRFNFTGTGINDTIPVEYIKKKINRVNRLLNNNMEDRYVSNCSSLRRELKKIPEKMFDVHYRYLENKIRYHSRDFSQYTSAHQYFTDVYQWEHREMEVFKDCARNNIYCNVPGAYLKTVRLDGDNATQYSRCIDYFIYK